MLAGAAFAANHYLNRTEKGRQMKRDITDKTGKLGNKLKEYVSSRNGHGSSDFLSDSNPTSSSGQGTGSPM